MVQAHIVETLATRQVKLGDKLPLKEIMEETNPTRPSSLTSTGQNIFVRVPSYHSLSSFFFPPLCALFFLNEAKMGRVWATNTLFLISFFTRSRKRAHK
jgi:hypothetical protein